MIYIFFHFRKFILLHIIYFVHEGILLLSAIFSFNFLYTSSYISCLFVFLLIFSLKKIYSVSHQLFFISCADLLYLNVYLFIYIPFLSFLFFFVFLIVFLSRQYYYSHFVTYFLFKLYCYFIVNFYCVSHFFHYSFF